VTTCGLKPKFWMLTAIRTDAFCGSVHVHVHEPGHGNAPLA
jgi:hypothetical protein